MKMLKLIHYAILCIIFSTSCDAKKNLRKLILYYPTGGENIKKDFTPYDNNY